MFKEIVLVVIMTASITLNLYLIVTDPLLRLSETIGDNGDHVKASNASVMIKSLMGSENWLVHKIALQRQNKTVSSFLK